MKLNYTILLMSTLCCLTSFSQSLKGEYGYDNLDSTISRKSAALDIQSNKIKLFGQGGISPAAYSKRDSLFEVKYKVRYILFGCESPYNSDAMSEYNKWIGVYLDKRYGKSWRKELHPDVIALRE